MNTFAFKTLTSSGSKLLIALLGVVFSIVLVNIQGGMFIGLIRKSTLLVDNCGADIWIGHRGIQNVDIASGIPTSWVYPVRGVEGVRDAEPYIVGGGMLQLPSGGFEGVLVVGYDSASQVGAPWAFSQGDLWALQRPDAISIDRLDTSRLCSPAIGDILEINNRRAKVVALTDGIVGFITTPYVFTSLENARDFTNIDHADCSYILATLHPSADAASTISEIQRRLPEADVYSKREFSNKTRLYWTLRTGLGMSFGSSTLLGLAVGLAMVAQSLYAFVNDNLESYAALKAIGASTSQLALILAKQGAAIAILGCLFGHLVSGFAYSLISSPRLTIAITPWLVGLSTILAFAICLLSAMLPLMKIRNVDPVRVLQG